MKEIDDVNSTSKSNKTASLGMNLNFSFRKLETICLSAHTRLLYASVCVSEGAVRYYYISQRKKKQKVEEVLKMNLGT